MKFTLFQIYILTLLIAPVNLMLSQTAIGQWRDHLPYSSALRVTEAGSKIYCSTSDAIFYYNKTDNSLGKLTKVEGLSDLSITAMSYDKSAQTLFIGYENGNIDLLKSNVIYNVSDIKRKLFSGSKSINNVCFYDGLGYISTGFGVVVMDMTKREIKATYYIGPGGDHININEVATDGANLFAATEQGIYKADMNSANLADFNEWNIMSYIPNYYNDFNTVVCFNGILYANFHQDGANMDTVYKISNLSWSYLDTMKHTVSSISVSGNKLLVCNTNKIQVFDSNENLTETIDNYNLKTVQVNTAIFDSDNVLWIADNINGLVKRNTTSSFESFIPNGPDDNKVVSISIEGNQLWAAAGGKNGSWNNVWQAAELHYFAKEQWKSYKSYNMSGLGNICDINKVLANPGNPDQVYAASWNYGLIEINNKQVTAVYTDANSSLQTIFPGESYFRIYGLAFDSNSNLWVTNSSVPNPISVKTSENTWYSLPYGSIINVALIGDIIVTQNNTKWVVLPKGIGLFAFDEKGTYEDTDDDDYKKFNILDENGQVISNEVFSIAEDHDGQIFVGTDKGIVVYYNPENVFTGSNFYAQRIVIPSDIEGQASYLLENEIITSIFIDGANRKWIGTENSGVFLMSADLTEQIYHFNTENSPLLSNNITAIAIDNQNGEVFFGTDKGIISYKGTATQGAEDFKEVYAFPNPVRENYTGPITIRGLVTNSNVKIADIAGNIVYETTAEGGQAIWYGKNFDGQRVQTGVYLVFSSNEDGSKTNITKILFIN